MSEKIIRNSGNYETEKVYGTRLRNQKNSVRAGIVLLAPAIFFLCLLFTQQAMHQNIPWLAAMFTWGPGLPLFIFYVVIIFFPIIAFLINLRFLFLIWFNKDSRELKISLSLKGSLLILAVAGIIIAVLFVLHGIGDAAGHS